MKKLLFLLIILICYNLILVAENTYSPPQLVDIWSDYNASYTEKPLLMDIGSNIIYFDIFPIGWSKDGKFAFIQRSYRNLIAYSTYSFNIVNMINDKIISHEYFNLFSLISDDELEKIDFDLNSYEEFLYIYNIKRKTIEKLLNSMIKCDKFFMKYFKRSFEP